MRCPLYSVSTVLRFHCILLQSWARDQWKCYCETPTFQLQKKFMMSLSSVSVWFSVCVFLYIVCSQTTNMGSSVGSLSLHGVWITMSLKKGTPTRFAVFYHLPTRSGSTSMETRCLWRALPSTVAHYTGVSLQSSRVAQHRSTFVQKPLMWLQRMQKAFDLSPQWTKIRTSLLKISGETNAIHSIHISVEIVWELRRTWIKL